jgi:presenilin-like A22 family membrane protease
MVLQVGHPYVEPEDYGSAGSTGSFSVGVNNLTEFYVTSLILFLIIAIEIYLKYEKKRYWKLINLIFLLAIVYIVFLSKFSIIDTFAIFISFTVILVILETHIRIIYIIAQSFVNLILKKFKRKNY